MLPRQLPSLLLVASALILTGLAAHTLLRPAPSPHTLGELTELLSRSPARLQVVKQTNNGVECGIYVCASPRPHDELRNLLRTPEAADSWRGVAFCENIGTHSSIPAQMLESWGEYGMQIGGFRLFGDPTVLRQIRDAARQGQWR